MYFCYKILLLRNQGEFIHFVFQLNDKSYVTMNEQYSVAEIDIDILLSQRLCSSRRVNG